MILQSIKDTIMDSNFEIDNWDIDNTLKELKVIAGQYNEGSKEQKALEIAAYAILFTYRESTFNKFRQYLRDCKKPLSNKQIEHLKKMGLYQIDASNNQ